EMETVLPITSLTSSSEAIASLDQQKKALENKGSDNEETQEMIRQIQEQIDKLMQQIDDIDNTEQRNDPNVPGYNKPGLYNPDLVGWENTAVETPSFNPEDIDPDNEEPFKETFARRDIVKHYPKGE